jgi:hypothetical protein
MIRKCESTYDSSTNQSTNQSINPGHPKKMRSNTFFELQYVDNGTNTIISESRQLEEGEGRAAWINSKVPYEFRY